MKRRGANTDYPHYSVLPQERSILSCLLGTEKEPCFIVFTRQNQVHGSVLWIRISLLVRLARYSS